MEAARNAAGATFFFRARTASAYSPARPSMLFSSRAGLGPTESQAEGGKWRGRREVSEGGEMPGTFGNNNKNINNKRHSKNKKNHYSTDKHDNNE
jgi:hypothetical protein